MGAPNGEGDLNFAPGLLDNAAKVLKSKPENPTVTQANATVVNVGAFGTVPGGADAGARVQTWIGRVKTELGRVAAEVTDLGDGTARAATLAADVNPRTAAAAELGRPRVQLTDPRDLDEPVR